MSTLPSAKDPGAPTAKEVSSRRLRKRELDRNAQRNARERTKNRIAYLERVVEDLRSENAEGPVARLMSQLSDVTNERDELSKALKTIENVLKGTRVVDRSTGIAYRPPAGSSDTDTKTDSSPDAQTRDADTPVTSSSQDLASGTDEPDLVIIPDKPECGCSAKQAARAQDLNRWRLANEILSGKPKLSTEVIRMEDALSEDTAIRAMIEGWDAVEASGRMSPLYQKLRRLDEDIFASCSEVDRLGMMRLMHLLLRYHSDPSEKRKADLPVWYLSRPSQDTIAHSYAINFFAWPGMRERFIFGQHRYCGNDFWRLFCDNTALLWPYEFRDCYTFNTQTGQYALSAAFESNVREINCWTMKPDMYERFPEFRADVVTFSSVPLTLPDPMIEEDTQIQEQQLVNQQSNSDGWLTSQSMSSWPMDVHVANYLSESTLNTAPFFPIATEFANASFMHSRHPLSSRESEFPDREL